MHKRALVIVLSALLTSCFSYKKVDLDQTELKNEDTYKITTVGRNIKKGKFQFLIKKRILTGGNISLLK